MKRIKDVKTIFRGFSLVAVLIGIWGCTLDLLKQPVHTGEEETTPTVFSVVYDGNGNTGGTPPSPERYSAGSIVVVRGNPGGLIKPLHQFSSWNTQQDGTGLIRVPDSTFPMPSQNITLYAQWERTFQPLYVVINDAGNVWTSADGSSWQGPYLTGLDQTYDLSFGTGVFVAVGKTGTDYGISWSSNGVDWNLLPMGVLDNAALVKLAVSPGGRFVAVGNPPPGYPNAFVSTDGKNWNGPYATVYTAVGPAWVDGSVYGNAFYLTTGNGIGWYKSADGSTWVNQGGTGSNMYSVLTLIGFNDRIIVGGGAPSNTNKQTRTSTDGGVTFAAAVNVNTAPGYVYGFAYNPTNNRVVAVGSGPSGQVNYSDDYGVSWTQASGIQGTATFQRAFFDGQRFWSGNDDGEVYLSLDGTSYSLSGSISGKIRGFAYKSAP